MLPEIIQTLHSPLLHLKPYRLPPGSSQTAAVNVKQIAKEAFIDAFRW